MQTFYFLYKTTNLLNGKYYIGKHKTRNLSDGYVGSGKLLKRAIEKYGIENFQFEVIEWFDSETMMNQREKELVTEEFCSQDDNYNLCVGGHGGFSYINRTGGSPTLRQFKTNDSVRTRAKATATRRLAELRKIEEFKQRELETARLRGIRMRGRPGTFNGRHHTEQTKRRISEANKIKSSGKGNSQFGTMWITDGINSKKIKAVDVIPDGWYKGRSFAR